MCLEPWQRPRFPPALAHLPAQLPGWNRNLRFGCRPQIAPFRTPPRADPPLEGTWSNAGSAPGVSEGEGRGMSQRKFVYRGNYYLHTKLFLPLNSAQFLFFGGGGASTTSVRFCRENYLGKKISHGKLFLPRTLAQVRAHQPARSERLSHYHLRYNLPSCHT